MADGSLRSRAPLARLDCHCHIWDPSRFEYAFLTPAVKPIVRAFSLDEYDRASGGSTSTLLVQALEKPDESVYLLDAARASSLVLGVIGGLDLEEPVEPQIEELDRRSTEASRLVGFRLPAIGHPAGWLTAPHVIAAGRLLAKLQYPIDLLVDHIRSLDAVHFVRAVETRIVINHVGMLAETEPLDSWRDRMRPLAENAQVACKLSGFDPSRRPDLDVRELAEACLDMFGPDRLLWGSDWPVCLLRRDLRATWALADAVVAAGGDETFVFAGNGARIYRVPIADP